MSIRAKFYCMSATELPDSKSFKLTPVIDGSEENKGFFKYTPGGEIHLQVVNKEVEFVPGQEYYVDFTPVNP